jgi:Arc/MetJ-type ribon-helix-helix transcriptional regulator
VANDSQIAIRLPDEDLKALDAAIASGRFENRAAALREALKRLLRQEYEDEIEREYKRAYTEQPQEEWVGEVGLILMAETIRAQEQADRAREQ